MRGIAPDADPRQPAQGRLQRPDLRLSGCHDADVRGDAARPTAPSSSTSGASAIEALIASDRPAEQREQVPVLLPDRQDVPGGVRVVMRYCRTCVTALTRGPTSRIDDEGICNACAAHTKRGIDWAGARAGFRAGGGPRQVAQQRLRLRDPGQRRQGQHLAGGASAWNTGSIRWPSPGARPARTAIGQRNLDNLVALGVDHIDYQISPQVETQVHVRGARALRRDRHPDAHGAVQHPADASPSRSASRWSSGARTRRSNTAATDDERKGFSSTRHGSSATA